MSDNAKARQLGVVSSEGAAPVGAMETIQLFNADGTPFSVVSSTPSNDQLGGWKKLDVPDELDGSTVIQWVEEPNEDYTMFVDVPLPAGLLTIIAVTLTNEPGSYVTVSQGRAFAQMPAELTEFFFATVPGDDPVDQYSDQDTFRRQVLPAAGYMSNTGSSPNTEDGLYVHRAMFSVPVGADTARLTLSGNETYTFKMKVEAYVKTPGTMYAGPMPPPVLPPPPGPVYEYDLTSAPFGLRPSVTDISEELEYDPEAKFMLRRQDKVYSFKGVLSLSADAAHGIFSGYCVPLVTTPNLHSPESDMSYNQVVAIGAAFSALALKSDPENPLAYASLPLGVFPPNSKWFTNPEPCLGVFDRLNNHFDGSMLTADHFIKIVFSGSTSDGKALMLPEGGEPGGVLVPNAGDLVDGWS